MKTDLIEIFQTIRAAMQPYEALGFNSRINSDREYELWSEKNVPLNKDKNTEVYFGGVRILENGVGFYFMPVFTESEKVGIFHPDLLKLLKDLSCFHIKQLDDRLMEHIASALDKGYKIYKQNEWV